MNGTPAFPYLSEARPVGLRGVFRPWRVSSSLAKPWRNVSDARCARSQAGRDVRKLIGVDRILDGFGWVCWEKLMCMGCDVRSGTCKYKSVKVFISWWLVDFKSHDSESHRHLPLITRRCGGWPFHPLRSIAAVALSTFLALGFHCWSCRRHHWCWPRRVGGRCWWNRCFFWLILRDLDLWY